jgi:hypothetical protein
MLFKQTPESVAYILICTEIIDDNDIFICTNWVKGLFQLYFKLYDIDIIV